MSANVASFFNSVVANDLVVWIHVGQKLAASFPRPCDAPSMKEYFRDRFRVVRVSLTHDDGDLKALQELAEQIESWKPELHRRFDFLVEVLPHSRSALASCYSFLEHEDFCLHPGVSQQDRLPNKILDDLYLGDISSSTNANLPFMGLTRIIDASGYGDQHYAAHPDFSYLVVDVDDSPTASAKLERNFERVVNFIKEARKEKQKVLIHCAAGISRSATLTLVFLMKEEGMSLREAWVLVKGARRIVRPNSGFTQLLCDLELKLRPENPSVIVDESMRNSYKLNLVDLTRK